ncbi:MAG: MarC family protein [Candidatus Brocadiaceae bacterium]|nr:MarC family protein [Candidatus Brocadiaceae bacterium]
MRDFWLCFVPLFVAVDAMGVTPMFVGLTEGLSGPRLHRIILQSLVVALAVGLLFLAVGKAVLALLGVSIADFMVAGGTLLFVLSVRDLVTVEKTERQVDPDSLGAVPLGVPLIAGPAVLTTSLLLLNQHGIVPTAAALTVNVLIAGGLFWVSPGLNRVLGKAGSKALSKLASLLLAAIGVMIVRRGIEMLLAGA